MKKQIALSKHERIIAIVPEYASGPGWANSIVNVHIVDYQTFTHRVEHLQTDEVPRDLLVLFGVGAKVHVAMMTAIEPVVKREKA